MTLPRHDRIRWVAAVVILLTAGLFTREPVDLQPAAEVAPTVLVALSGLLWMAAALYGLRRCLALLLGTASDPQHRAAALVWTVVHAALAATAAVGAARGAGMSLAPAWSLVPFGIAAAALIDAAVAERVGLREGLLSLPLWIAFGGLAAAGIDADPRYLQALLLAVVVVVPAIAILLPVPQVGNRAWLLAAAGWGAALAGLLLLGPTIAQALAALTTAWLTRLLPREAA